MPNAARPRQVRRSRRARRGLEVVDLLEPGLVAGDVLVVLVGRVRRPVLGGRDDLADDELGGIQRLRGAEVVHLPARRAGAAQFDGRARGGMYATGRVSSVGASATATRPSPRELRGGARRRGTARRSARRTPTCGRAAAVSDSSGIVAMRDRERSRERHDDPLDAAVVEGQLSRRPRSSATRMPVCAQPGSRRRRRRSPSRRGRARRGGGTSAGRWCSCRLSCDRGGVDAAAAVVPHARRRHPPGVSRSAGSRG